MTATVKAAAALRDAGGRPRSAQPTGRAEYPLARAATAAMPLGETARQRVAGDVKKRRFDWVLHQIEANRRRPDAMARRRKRRSPANPVDALPQ